MFEGVGKLIGDWFVDVYYDDVCCGWGIVFFMVEEKVVYELWCWCKFVWVGELILESALFE